MENVLAMLNTNAGLISAIATVVIAALTAVLWFENRSLRKSGAAPEIVSYLLPHRDGNGAVQFVLANVGRGPAFNVSFELLNDEADFAAHDVMLINDPERMPISVLPQDETMSALLGISYHLYGKVDEKDIGPLKPFKVRMMFSDIFGRKHKSERTLDIRQFAGLRGVLEKSNDRKISEALEKIERHMAQVARQSSRFSAFVDTTEFKDECVRKAKGAPHSDSDN